MAVRKQPAGNGTNGALAAFFNLVGGVVEKFGWPGTILILGFSFVVFYATADQKHRIIEMYVLGNGTPFGEVLVCVLFSIVLWAQHSFQRRKLLLERERAANAEMEKLRIQSQLEEANRRLRLIEGTKPAKAR